MHTPRGLRRVLGLGLKFCVRAPRPSRNISLDRLENAVRRAVYFSNVEKGTVNQEKVEPRFYIPTDWKPDPGEDEEVEQALQRFKESVHRSRVQCRKPTMSNLRPSQLKTINSLKNHPELIIIAADKNLGACAMSRDEYIRRGLNEHLNNQEVYKLLDEDTAQFLSSSMSVQIRHFACKYAKEIGTDQRRWLIHQVNTRQDLPLPKFRMTAKVHKDPYKMRPIVCCVGTLLNALSEWLDWQLGRLLHLVHTYLKDSYQLLDELNKLGRLPAGCMITTADATAMYTNMDTPHLLEVLEWWLDKTKSEGQLPHAFPVQAVVEATRLVMENNLFQFGDCFYLQLSGGAMGSSSVCKLSTIYFNVREEYLLSKYSGNIHFIRRFIDDIILFWKPDASQDQGMNERYELFKNDLNNFGLLKWKAEKLSYTANF